MWIVRQGMYCQVQKPSINSIKVKQSLHGPMQFLRGSESDKVVSQPSEPAFPQQTLQSAAELNPGPSFGRND